FALRDSVGIGRNIRSWPLIYRNLSLIYCASERRSDLIGFNFLITEEAEFLDVHCASVINLQENRFCLYGGLSHSSLLCCCWRASVLRRIKCSQSMISTIRNRGSISLVPRRS